MKRIGIKTLICLLFLVCPFYAFYDNFELYNNIADPFFTLNYTTYASTGGSYSIASSNGVFLRYSSSYGSDSRGEVIINKTKLNSVAPFTASYDILAGSV